MGAIFSPATLIEPPITIRIFKIFAPMILPSKISLCPLTTLAIPVASSGTEVPKATIVAAMTSSGTPNFIAIWVAEPIRTLLAMIIMNKPAKKITDKAE